MHPNMDAIGRTTWHAVVNNRLQIGEVLRSEATHKANQLLMSYAKNVKNKDVAICVSGPQVVHHTCHVSG